MIQAFKCCALNCKSINLEAKESFDHKSPGIGFHVEGSYQVARLQASRDKDHRTVSRLECHVGCEAAEIQQEWHCSESPKSVTENVGEYLHV
jgi:hypothetical protein